MNRNPTDDRSAVFARVDDFMERLRSDVARLLERSAAERAEVQRATAARADETLRRVRGEVTRIRGDVRKLLDDADRARAASNDQVAAELDDFMTALRAEVGRILERPASTATPKSRRPRTPTSAAPAPRTAPQSPAQGNAPRQAVRRDRAATTARARIKPVH